MSNWLKKFEETAFGMLFKDQYLSPSEVVKIAEKVQTADKIQRCGTSANEADATPAQIDASPVPTSSINAHDMRLSTPR